MKQIHFLFFLIYLLTGLSALAQESSPAILRSQIENLVAPFHATVGIAVRHIETGDTITWNGYRYFPMQSVYKFPQALAVLSETDKGRLSLSQKYRLTKEDLLPRTWSPMKSKYPEGNVELTLAELLRYAVSESDNIACDILFKIMKGTKPVNDYIHHAGFPEIDIVATEDEMHSDVKVQYHNRCRPIDMSRLLEDFYHNKFLSDSSYRLLMRLMLNSTNDSLRIKGMLPAGTPVAHKTGTGDLNADSLISACNDVGLITLPDGTHLALSVFVSNSAQDYSDIRQLIAQITKVIFDYYSGAPFTSFTKAKHGIFITHLTGDFYIYTTEKVFNDNPPVIFPANGMYLVTDSGVVMIETPWTEDQFQPLLDSIRTRHHKKVVLCISTHSHDDRTAGLEYYTSQRIPTYTTVKTDSISHLRKEKRSAYLIQHDTTFSIGQYSFQTYYPGEGHAPDNIVVWFPKDKILFGGCLVKSTEATDLGNLKDANVSAWPVSIKNVQEHYPAPVYIIPGHYGWSGENALQHTLMLLKDYEKK